jgi:hypothetical protein
MTHQVNVPYVGKLKPFFKDDQQQLEASAMIISGFYK